MSETIQLVTTETPETPVSQEGLSAHDQQMIDKAEGKSTDDGSQTLLAGKYKDEAALDKGMLELVTKLYGSKEDGYKKLESLLGKPKSEDGKAPLPIIPETPKKDNDKPLEIPDASKALDKAGLDFKALDKEYQEKGQLSADSYKKLADAGLSKDYVDTYIAGIKAQVALKDIEAQQIVSAVHTIAGGPEAYNVMIQWASQNLTPDEIKVLNEGLLGDAVHAKIAAENLKTKYTAANGSNPLLYMGTNPVTSGDVFKDRSEMSAAMKDPRYKTSEAYRAEVALKVGRSKIFG